ncbi:hypothetical protein niasHT_002910 [Heterodera trifolii]|uniref:Uncharacterized protein n=1 Tax=Heterodera trifolii TaxID=157864 RepID=A0ABD2LPA7_9BILA
MASLNTTAPSETELFLLFLGGAVELITTLVGIPLSIANLILVARTSVIHPNMKAILIFQSFFILLRGSCRFVICLFKFFLWDPIGAKYVQFFPALRKMYFIGIYARNFVPHVLIVERILATLFVRTYEKNRGHLFTILWTPFALIIPIYISFSTSPQNGQNQPITNLITTAVQLVIGSIECHPFLKRDLCQFLNCIGTMFGFNHLANNHRIGDATAAPSLSAVNGIAQRNLISGKAMINARSKPEEHFAVLKEAWEKGPMKRQNANSRK